MKTAGRATAIELAKGTYGGVISNRSMGVAESCSYKSVDMYFSCYTGDHHSGNETKWGECNWKSEGGYSAQHITDVVSLPNYTAEQFEEVNNTYIKYLNSAVTVGNLSGDMSFDMEKLEKEFLKFMRDKMNMVGFKLFKINNNGTNTEIYLENEA
ncbi:hypothetical protein DBR28_16565 [Chryseobacterium sp. HMWF028]|nr:hypothetical protein DBR28_16565 [Chryseobacterium sp. HMWF028]